MILHDRDDIEVTPEITLRRGPMSGKWYVKHGGDRPGGFHDLPGTPFDTSLQAIAAAVKARLIES